MGAFPGAAGLTAATLACVDTFAKTDFRQDLKGIKVSTLVIHGDDDRTVPFDASGRRTAQLVPGTKLVVYPGAPHGLFHPQRAAPRRTT